MINWQQDNWVDIETEEGEILDANLWTDESTGRQYITFYPTSINAKGFRDTCTSAGLSTYKVVLAEEFVSEVSK